MSIESGISFRMDATDGKSRFLDVEIEIKPPFTSNNLKMHFPRWVPGSYFIREPMQYVTDLTCSQEEKEIPFSRKNVDCIAIKIQNAKCSITIKYKILGIELSCRSTHVDSSHLHMMPPFTFLLPTDGINSERMNKSHIITLNAPKDWTTATQLNKINTENTIGITGEQSTLHIFSANNRDELLDGILEANSNPNIEFDVDGRKHILKLWDSGGYHTEQKMIDQFVDDMKKVIKEHHALFGIPNWGKYVTVLHLTEKSRGGLEHLNSQTSMLPRTCLIEGHIEGYRDLVSLFSHEYLHQWNVKRLRPKNFIDYDLQKEVHTNLLWWFEGCTSWLGDMLCVRSGAWSEEDWRKDFERKLKRHLIRNGMEHESLSESSHDAWIHLYRSNHFSREIQISYYLEGELAIFCIDAELRRRSKGKHGICDLMVRLCEKYALEYSEVKNPGIVYKDIRKELVSMEGGRNLGKMLDRLVFNRKCPDVITALKYYGLDLKRTKKLEEKVAKSWLGLNLSERDGKIIVTSHRKDSPLRNVMMPGDEIISINSLRTTKITKLKKILSNLEPNGVDISFTHEGIVHTKKVNLQIENELQGKLNGDGNKKWRDYISTRSLSS